MSRGFAGIGQVPFIGTPFALPVQTINTQFERQQPLPPTTIALQFNWLNYGASTLNPNINALIDLPGGSARQKLDKIYSCRIDNLGNPVPVYVYFPDTAYTVVAPPNSVVWEPVQTAQFSAWVIAEGFTTGNVGSTAVYLCNFLAPPFIDYEFEQVASLWKASATISRGQTIYNQNFGVPALGDQTVQYLNVVTTTGVIQNNVWGTPYASGFLYLTHVDFSLTQLDMNAVGPSSTFTAVLESTGTAGMLYQVTWGAKTPAAFNAALDTQKLLNFSGMNVKLDATQTWRIRCTTLIQLTGNLTSAFNFTTNPQ